MILQGVEQASHVWFDYVSQEIIKFMHEQMRCKIIIIITSYPYVILVCDEVITVDNGSQIFIHACIMNNWVNIPILINLQKVVTGARVNSLITMIMEALEQHGTWSQL